MSTFRNELALKWRSRFGNSSEINVFGVISSAGLITFADCFVRHPFLVIYNSLFFIHLIPVLNPIVSKRTLGGEEEEEEAQLGTACLRYFS